MELYLFSPKSLHGVCLIENLDFTFTPSENRTPIPRHARTLITTPTELFQHIRTYDEAVFYNLYVRDLGMLRFS
jgi:hypothetical protein